MEPFFPGLHPMWSYNCPIKAFNATVELKNFDFPTAPLSRAAVKGMERHSVDTILGKYIHEQWT